MKPESTFPESEYQMRTRLQIVLATSLLALSSSGLALAADHMSMHEHGNDAMQAQADQTVLSVGVVKKIDKVNAKLTIAHGPLQNLQMPAMTMSFKLKNPAWADSVKLGDKVNFLAEDNKGELLIVRLEPAK